MTKIKKISVTPEAMEKSPRTRNAVVKMLPARSTHERHVASPPTLDTH